MSTQAQPAPSAEPVAAPEAAATPTPAPSAPQGDPNTLEYYVNMARESLSPAEEPPVPAAEEPPAAGAGTTAEPPPTQPPAADPDAEAEPSAEELAQLGEPGRRALQREREQRKEARAQLKAVREELDALKAKLDAKPDPNAPAAPSDPAAQSSQPGGSQPVGSLEDCQTFDAVDSVVMTAARTEAQVLKLQGTLTRRGLDPVRTALKEAKVEQVGGVPLEEATEDQVADFLGKVYEGTRLTVAGADARKRFLVGQAQSMERALQKVPNLKTPGSAERKEFDQILRQTPWITRQGPNWPEVVAKQVLGMQQWNGSTAASTPATPAPTTPAPRSTPGAPNRNASGVPQANRMNALQAKFADGTASREEIEEYARLSVK